MYTAKTTKQIAEVWEGCSHNLLYTNQYVMRLLKTDPVLGTARVRLEDGSEHTVFAHQISIETTEETKRKENAAKIESGELMVIYRRCPGPCGGRERRFELEAVKVARWHEGAAIQSVWPEMSVSDRETLISGLCSECFDNLPKE